MKKEEIFDLGFGLVLLIFMNLFVTTSLFIFKCSITMFNSILSLLLTVCIYAFILKRKSYDLRKIFKFVGTFIVIVFVSILVSGLIFDNSYDGNSYHKTAVGELKMGWNPVYESIDEFNNRAEIKLNNTFALWNDHYGKGYWICAANVYKVTNNIETGKSITLVTVIATFLMSFAFFHEKLGKKLNWAISLLIAFNPVILCQIGTFYNDGVLGNLLIMMILSLSVMANKKEEFPKIQNYIFYFMTLCILINIKFTGFAYAGIYSVVYYVYFVVNKDLRKECLRPITITAIFALIVGIGVIGLSTYPKNFIEHGHPFYPLYGSDSTDIMENNTPNGLKNMNSIKKFAVANFSASMNDVGSESMGYNLRTPFIFRPSELKAFTYPDARVGGYGVLFSGILLISVVALIYYFVKRKSFYQSVLFLLPMVATLMLIVIIKESWWARYLPQLYIIPIIIVVMLKTLVSNKLSKILEKLLLILLVVNSLLVLASMGGGLIIRNKEVYQEFKAIEVHGGHWNVASEEFPGALFNVIDRVDNVKLVEKCDENSEIFNAMNGKVCFFVHNKN